jgi:hypothetical protein
MIVKQPRVDVAFAQRRLDGSQVHGQTSIVNNGKDLSESGGGTGASKSSSLEAESLLHYAARWLQSPRLLLHRW